MRRFLLALAFLAAAAAGANAQEIIHRFESAIEVAKDGTLAVTETVVVRRMGTSAPRAASGWLMRESISL